MLTRRYNKQFTRVADRVPPGKEKGDEGRNINALLPLAHSSCEMNTERQSSGKPQTKLLPTSLYLVRWITVPLMLVAAIVGTTTQDSFHWSTGPYAPVLGAWLIGYGLWAGYTSAARAISAAEIDISAGTNTTKRNVRDAIATYRGKPHAKYEFFAVVIVIALAAGLPETGLQILGLTAAHMLFVFTFRYFTGVTQKQQ